mmetsp:Transcript_1236/g.8130  ORF Transcript_1236/g.8130 Transcript_1236/m.8130 type:complete len:143 (+) Transcript_1236:1154-1582(+)
MKANLSDMEKHGDVAELVGDSLDFPFLTEEERMLKCTVRRRKTQSSSNAMKVIFVCMQLHWTLHRCGKDIWSAEEEIHSKHVQVWLALMAHLTIDPVEVTRCKHGRYCMSRFDIDWLSKLWGGYQLPGCVPTQPGLVIRPYL